MKIKNALLVFTAIVFAGCQSGYYSEEDYLSVLKVDSHIHINSDDGVFEDQAAEDNFVLITLNVDHSDSANIRKQFDYAVSTVKKHPGQGILRSTFLFDTTGWGTEAWSTKIISQLEKDIADGAIAVKIWKNVGMTVRDRNGKFIMVDDPGLDKVIDFIISKNLPIAGHLGEPRNCWLPLNEMTVSSDSSYFARNPQYHMFLHPEYPSYEDQMNARDNLLRNILILLLLDAILQVLNGMLIRLQSDSTDSRTWRSTCPQGSAISSTSRQRTGIESEISV